MAISGTKQYIVSPNVNSLVPTSDDDVEIHSQFGFISL